MRIHIKDLKRQLARTWLGEPIFWIGLGIGSLIVGTLRMPLLPPLQESAATILGATIGSILAVSGAAYLANFETKRSARRTKFLLFATLLEVIRSIDLVFECADKVDSAKHWSIEQLGLVAATFEAVTNLVPTMDRIDARLSIFVRGASNLDPTAVISAADAQTVIRAHKAAAQVIARFADAKPDHKQMPDAYFSGRFAGQYRRDLQPLRNELDVIMKFL